MDTIGGVRGDQKVEVRCKVRGNTVLGNAKAGSAEKMPALPYQLQLPLQGQPPPKFTAVFVFLVFSCEDLSRFDKIPGEMYQYAKFRFFKE